MTVKRYPHIVLTKPLEESSFKSANTPRNNKNIPQERNRKFHSTLLKKKLDIAWKESKSEQVACHATRHGIYLEFKGEPGFDLITKSLEDMRSKKVRLLNIRNEIVDDSNQEQQPAEKTVSIATVYVSNEKKEFFFNKIEQYAKEINSTSGKPKNQDLINSISDIRSAQKVESFWIDAKSLIPKKEPQWCEIWLSSDTGDVIERFENLLENQGILSKDGFIRFPERAVKVIFANRSQLEKLTILSDDIAEYRRAKETASFWTEMKNIEQAEWVKDLKDRIKIEPDSNVSICILDTGVNNGHPLLAPLLSDEDCQAVNDDWGTYDHDKHGSLMAGVSGYGDLASCLSNNSVIEIRHCLESVKILPLPPKQTEPDLWGYITAQGIYRAEIQAPQRNRTVCMAVSSTDTQDKGRPSSWSGQLDQLASGCEDDTQRLLVVCAGNSNDISNIMRYPESQIEDSIQDPGQSWNALTVGSYTCLDQINNSTYAGYEPIAPRDCLSPFSTTSSSWDDVWPIKPEIVMEGGNLAKDSSGFVTECEDLSILSTYYKPQEANFYPFNMTSASTASTVWFASQIQVKYPDLWPETIRALIVHSAKWPENLKKQFVMDDKKTSLKRLLRICGYGVPDLQQALYSASNSLTLISQSIIQPFDKKENISGYKTRDMHLYNLPWPKEELQNLPLETEVEMRVTLSYFIEPGPGEIGWKDRYRYASHGLRFHLTSPGESGEEFVRRVNAAARNEEQGRPETKSSSKHWVIGSQARNKGSIHSDIWKGTAAELADSNIISVSLTIGWWRERHHLKRWGKKTRYALVVSITTPHETVDIYTPVAVKVGVMVPIEIPV
ncbi:S8 family peptidase [Desulfobacterales bacterium HSG17]|nr:S8 family peptidase [Desulfobacterales bacterium HSG17]